MAHDVDCYHSDSFMTLLATITPSLSHNSNLSLNSPLTSPPPWLVEIHTKLWGRPDLFGDSIFHTANLPKADFIELQRQLQELNPERNSESYVAKDVLAAKFAFLRSRSTALFGTNLGMCLVPDLPPIPHLLMSWRMAPRSPLQMTPMTPTL